MNNPALSDEDIDEAVRLLGLVVEAFADEMENEPTLGEFLEILGLSVPTGREQMEATPFPLVFKAKTKGNRWYKSESSARVADLNDNTFSEAADLLSFVAERAAVGIGRVISPTDLSDYVFQVLRAGKVSFSDISSGDVLGLKVDAPKRIKTKVGDVLAIPAGESTDSGYRFAVVLADDKWGLAVGLLQGTFPQPRLGNVDQYRPGHTPVYTGDALIADGRWRIIGHQEKLFALFPDPPEIYLAASSIVGDKYGKFGAAVTGKGTVRLIEESEAEQIGLLNGTYRQSYVDEWFQKMLQKGHFDNGPLPGFWR